MRSYYYAADGAGFGMNVVIASLTVSLFIGVTGCSSPKAAPKPGSAAAASNTNSRGLPKLTASEVKEKVRAVQSSTTYPESAKPKIIDSIRAQGEP